MSSYILEMQEEWEITWSVKNSQEETRWLLILTWHCHWRGVRAPLPGNCEQPSEPAKVTDLIQLWRLFTVNKVGDKTNFSCWSVNERMWFSHPQQVLCQAAESLILHRSVLRVPEMLVPSLSFIITWEEQRLNCVTAFSMWLEHKVSPQDPKVLNGL